MRSVRIFLITILLGVLVGLLGAGFRLGLDGLVHLIDLLIQHQTSFPAKLFVSTGLSCTMVFCAWKAVNAWAPETAGSGIQEVERTLVHHAEVKWWRLIPVKFIGGILALGSKLVLGREGPTIHLGAGAGAMVSALFGLSEKEKTRLVAAGAAAGLATAFNAPLAGILFIFEEIRPGFKMSWTHLQCVTLVSLVSVMVLYLILGNHPAIQMGIYDSPPLISLGVFLFFGCLMGGVGWFFNVSLIKILDHVETYSTHARHVYVLSVALLIGLFGVLSPYFVTGGYDILEHVLNTSVSVGLLIAALMIRWVLGLMSYSLGVPGGIFAPILVLGAIMGLLFYNCFTALCVATGVQPGMLALTGMCGLFAAVVRSPLTAVILIIEMTKNGSMVVPLLETSIVACICINWLGNPPIYTQLLNRTATRI